MQSQAAVTPWQRPHAQGVQAAAASVHEKRCTGTTRTDEQGPTWLGRGFLALGSCLAGCIAAAAIAAVAASGGRGVSASSGGRLQRQGGQHGVQVGEVLVEGARVLVLKQAPRQILLVLPPPQILVLHSPGHDLWVGDDDQLGEGPLQELQCSTACTCMPGRLWMEFSHRRCCRDVGGEKGNLMSTPS